MTKGLIVSSKISTKLYRKSIHKARTDSSYLRYITYRNLYNKLKRKAKINYYQEKLNTFKYDIRNTWKTLRTIIGSQKDKSSTSQSFTINNETITDPNIIADNFCQYFSTVGQSLANKIPQPRICSRSYLSSRKERNNNSFFMNPTDPTEISNIIKALKPKKSCGIDNLSSYFLKLIAGSLANPITLLINESLNSGIVPSALKIAKVTPIYKAKSKNDFTNYRPISILPTISKILEKVVYKRLYSFIQNFNIFYNKQFGFRNKHSTSHAITKLITDIVQSNEKKETTLSVFLDLSKAFDTIDHTILLNKLNFYGIRGHALEWFKSYLTDRTQFVTFNDKQSNYMDITCGVPQGSVLGPLLFIIYTNDLPDCLSHCETILFADDTTIYESSTDVKYLYTNMNKNLENLSDWFKSNKLSLNISKTNYILFTNSKTNVEHFKLHICNTQIDRTNKTKFLGLHIDTNLKWNYHIDYIKARISGSLYAINKIKHFVPTSLLVTLYYSLVYPYLIYGITLWGSAAKNHLSKIIIMQKKIIRAIVEAPYNAHTNTIFHKLNILKLEDIYKLYTAKFTLSYLKQELPAPLLNLYTTASEPGGQNIRTNHHYKLKLQHRRTLAASQSIIHKAPSIWNSIPSQLYLDNHGMLSTMTGFASRYKRSIIGGYVS